MSKTVSEYLNEVDYEKLKDYKPSSATLEFINFIQMCEDGQMENKTPVVHLVALDKAFNSNKATAIMCHRGFAKSSLFAEMLFLFIACFGRLPGNKDKVNFALYIADSIDNGVKSLRKNMEFRYQNSEFLKRMIPNTTVKYSDENGDDVDVTAGRKFTDVRIEFANVRGDHFVLRLYGAKALSLDSKLYMVDRTTTIKDCKIGDEIFAADGTLCKIIAKSEVFNKPMYKITLDDGRSIKVSEDHINSIVYMSRDRWTENGKHFDKWVAHEANITTKELLKLALYKEIKGINYKKKEPYISKKPLVFIKNCKALQYPKKELPIDPYTLGLLLGDGQLKNDGSSILTSHKDDWKFYKTQIPYELGNVYSHPRDNHTTLQVSIKGLSKIMRIAELTGKGSYDKFIPYSYFTASIEQRLSLLQGLMDTDGSITSERKTVSFGTTSLKLAEGVMKLVRSLGGTARLTKCSIRGNYAQSYKVHIHIDLNPFRLPRKASKHKSPRIDRVPICSIERIADEPSQCIAIDNVERQFITEEYVRTHNTGVRGAKELGVRPQLAIIDDIISDEDARSETVIASIEDVIHKAVKYALHPKKHKVIWLGTPFNANDPLYKAVESGSYEVACFPVCEKFPCTKEEFRGSWEDRFDYEYVKASYEEALGVGKVDSFYQELMLQIMSDENRIVRDEDIIWFEKNEVLKYKHNYNFYITTDFATSQKSSADYSVISVWGINNNGDYLLVDGICKKQLMDKNIDDLFVLASVYKPLGVGIEVSGQQKGFVSWIQSEMVKRNVFFNLLSSNNDGQPGIRPIADKFARFNLFLPRIKAKKLWIPKELKGSAWMNEFIDEISKASISGFKSKHDDVLDTISMLASFEVYKPSANYQLGKEYARKYLPPQDDDYVSSVIF